MADDSWSSMFDADDPGPDADADDVAEVLVDAPDFAEVLPRRHSDVGAAHGTTRDGRPHGRSADDSMDLGLPTRELLAQLLVIPPCLPVLGSLLAVDRTTLAPDDAITFVRVLSRQVASLAAVEAEATVAAASGHPVTEEVYVLSDAARSATPGPGDRHGSRQESGGERLIRIHDAAREEYASALRISQQQAHTIIETSRLLVGPLVRTLDALAGGEITQRHAAVVAEAASRLPGAGAVTSTAISDSERAELAVVHDLACSVLQDRVLPTACRATVSMTRQRANRAVLAIDPQGHEQRRRRARCTQDVWVTHEQDGHSLLMARMATARALACMTAIDAAATDPRLEAYGHVDCDATIGQRRVEVLDRMIQAGVPDHNGLSSADTIESRQRVRVHVDVTIPLDALLGGSDAPGEFAAGSGRGPRIDASIDEVRELLSDPDVDATMRRLVTDPATGHLLDVGRDRYQVPARLREFVAFRDRICRFPGCQRRATLCQIDHAIAWDDGGETSRANLGALCTRHHQLKTHAGWQISDSSESGSCTWISPLGRPYDTPPRQVLDPPDDSHTATILMFRRRTAHDPDPPPF